MGRLSSSFRPTISWWCTLRGISPIDRTKTACQCPMRFSSWRPFSLLGLIDSWVGRFATRSYGRISNVQRLAHQAPTRGAARRSPAAEDTWIVEYQTISIDLRLGYEPTR